MIERNPQTFYTLIDLKMSSDLRLQRLIDEAKKLQKELGIVIKSVGYIDLKTGEQSTIKIIN